MSLKKGLPRFQKCDVLFFSYNENLYSKAIKWFTGSDWTHVALITGRRADGAYEVSEALNDGFTTSWYNLEDIKDRIAIKRVPLSNYQKKKVIDYTRSVDGYPYDKVAIGLMALFKYLPIRLYDNPISLFCSEFGVRALAVGGVRLLPEKSFEKITPGEMFDAIKKTIYQPS